MSIAGEMANSRAPEERNVYSKSAVICFQKAQRGDMFIDARHILATQAPEGRHVGNMASAAKP